jgi:hypothetical protein
MDIYLGRHRMAKADELLGWEERHCILGVFYSVQHTISFYSTKFRSETFPSAPSPPPLSTPIRAASRKDWHSVTSVALLWDCLNDSAWIEQYSSPVPRRPCLGITGGSPTVVGEVALESKQ